MAEQTYQRVCRVIGELSGLPVDGIGPGQSLGHQPTPNFYDRDGAATPIGLDSLDRVDLAMKLETEFAIQLPDDEVDDLALDHVGGLCAFIQGKLDGRPTYGDISVKLIEYCIKHPLSGQPVLKPHHKGPMTLAEIMEAEGCATVAATFTGFGVEITPDDVFEPAATATSACMFGSTELHNSGIIEVSATDSFSFPALTQTPVAISEVASMPAEAAMARAGRAQAELRRAFVAGFGMGKGGAEYSEVEANAAWHTFRQGNVVALGNCA